MSAPYEELFERGLAIGWSKIRTDSMEFHFREERFDLPTVVAHPIAKHNGYFYTAKIEALRKAAGR